KELGRGREKIVLPAEDIVGLPDQDVDVGILDSHEGVAQAKRGAVVISRLRYRGRLARLVAEKVGFQHCARPNVADGRSMEREPDTRVSYGELIARYRSVVRVRSRHQARSDRIVVASGAIVDEISLQKTIQGK